MKTSIANFAADRKKERTTSYSAFYGSSGLNPVAPRIGFKPNTSIIKKSNFDEVSKSIADSWIVSLDVECTGLRFAECDLISINIGCAGKNWVGFYYTGFFTDEQIDKLPSSEALDDIVRQVLKKEYVAFWNRKFDQLVLQHTRGFTEEWFWNGFDMLILLWALDTNVKSGLGLKQSAVRFLGYPNWGMEDGVFEDITAVNPAVLLTYGGWDASATYELGVLLINIWKRYNPVMLRLLHERENALHSLMEQRQPLDRVWLEQLEKDLTTELEGQQNAFYSEYGVVNINSPRQVSDLLFRCGYNTGKMSKPALDGTPIMAVGAEYLEKLMEAPGGCLPAKYVLRLRKLTKLIGSYVRPMLTLLREGKPARFYFKDHAVATLRLSAGVYRIKNKPYDYYLPLSIQCLPKAKKINRELNYDPETFKIEWLPAGQEGQYLVETSDPRLNIRKAFGYGGPGHGWVVRADYEAVEVIVPSILSNERVWLDAYKNGTDLHAATGKVVFGDSYDNATQRKIIKAATFGLMYEVDNQEYTLSNSTGWPLPQAKAFFDKYRAGLPALYAWKDRCIQEAKITGTIKTDVFGFERRVWSYFHSNSKALERYGRRTVISQKVQGLCACILMVDMVKLWKMLSVPGGAFYNRGIFPMVSLHDELDIHVPNDFGLLRDFIPAFREVMEGSTPKGWPVRLRAEVELGYNFGETFVIEQDSSGLWLPKSEERKAGASPPVITEALVDEWAEQVEGELAEEAGFSFG